MEIQWADLAPIISALEELDIPEGVSSIEITRQVPQTTSLATANCRTITVTRPDGRTVVVCVPN